MYNQDAPSTETFIPTVMAKTICDKHAAEKEEPCYMVDFHLRGVCNARAKRAGFDHPISDKARLNRHGSSAQPRRKGR